MTNYDFASLNDKEFEVLIADLLSLEHGIRFERFKAGKDGGIDGRYFAPNSGQVIFQCKHWAKSGLPALLISLKKTELNKVTRLNPARYILVTSIPLSIADKTKIKTIFGKYILSEADIFGSEDINDLLRKHNHVEKSHFKLWLHSTEVLSTFSNAAILGRSEFTLSEIHNKNALYVKTAGHSLASEKIKNNNVLLITGEPGIGKTTLAEQLCLEYVVTGFQLCVAARQIEELENLYLPDAKQIFYFDDFLGSNFLEVLDRHEDSHIVGFIKRVSKDKKKRFILTSRTTVLNRGKTLTERFKIEKIDKHEFELEVKSLTDSDKAKILHSCLWFSGLPREYLDVIIGEKRYWKIIRHKNFNPRLISFITDPGRFDTVLAKNYWEYIEEKLQNPSDIWEHVYNNQLNDWSRAILLLVVFSGNFISEERLRASYDALILDSITKNYRGESDFDRCVRLLIGSVLNRSTDGKNISFTLFNPSIADYVLRKNASNPQLLVSLLFTIQDIRSLNSFLQLVKNGIMSAGIAKDVIQHLCKAKLKGNVQAENIRYQSHLASAAMEMTIDDSASLASIWSFIEAVSALPECSKYLGKFASVLGYSQKNKLLPVEIVTKFFLNIDVQYLERSELEDIAKIIPWLPKDAGVNLADALKPVIVEFWQDSIHEEIVERDILGEFFTTDDTSKAVELAKQEIEEILGEYEISFAHSDYSAILQYLDFDDIISGNIKRSMNDHYDDEREEYVDQGEEEIDDLFSFDLPMP